MKKLLTILCCIVLAFGAMAQESGSEDLAAESNEGSVANLDSLSPKDRIFYHYDRSEFDEVVRCCNEALGVYQATDDLFEMAGCYNILGIACQRLGRFKEAIESYEQCARIMERLKESEIALHKEGAEAFYDRNIRYTRNNMAQIYFSMNEFDQAEKLYRNCIEMLGEPRDTIDYLDLATYLQNLSEVSLQQAAVLEGPQKEERLESAVGMAEQALELSQRYNDTPFKTINKLVLLSQAYHSVGRADEALALAKEALDMAETVGDPYLLVEIHGVYGEFEANANHYEEAERHYRQAVAIATENHFDELLMTTLNGAYEAAKQFDKGLALDYFERGTALKDSIFNAEQQQLIRDYQVKYDLAEKDYIITLEEEKIKTNHQRIVFLKVFAVLLMVLLVIGICFGIKLNRRNRTLARINKAKDHLLSVVAHDFKTSVVSQTILLEALNEFYDNMTAEQVKEKLLTLKTSADSLKEKLFNLFEWIKTGSDPKAIKKEKIDLRKIVDECVAANATELGLKQLNVVSDIPQLPVYDNINMVRLVLQNLLSNAIKFSWPRQEISISAVQEADRVWVSVKDSGTGMSADRRNALLKNTVLPMQGTKNESGTGIGLMLCHQLLIQNGGDIIIESKEGQGTTVRFSLMTRP